MPIIILKQIISVYH